MRRWTIGASYKDYKRNSVCILVAITPYKAKSGSYLNFKYINGTYKRQSAIKALSRYEKIGEMSQTGTSDYIPAKNITSQIENFIEATIASPMPKTKRVSKCNALIWYANVIYIDFIKKCKIIVKQD